MHRFDRIERLGGGALGEVWRAKDRRTGREVALRLITESDAARAAALIAVARRAQEIRDPRVVAVHDAARDGDTVWVAMELVQGRTLLQVLDEEGPFSPERLVDVACQVCGALDASQKGGLWHRDLKPGSVMLTDSGLKVLDFGLAHARAHRATGRYASPESRFGYPVDERADLYSLGVLLMELATGSEYRDEDEHEAPVIEAPLIAGSHMPPAVTAVLLRLLHKDAGARFRSAAAVADALRRALPRPSMVVKEVKRRRVRRGALLGAAIAVAGVLGVVLVSRGRVGEALGTAAMGCGLGPLGRR